MTEVAHTEADAEADERDTITLIPPAFESARFESVPPSSRRFADLFQRPVVLIPPKPRAPMVSGTWSR